METRDTELGEMDFPVISGWPSRGVGRINPDGSNGACSACHSRHEFSIEMARKPYTCMECHSGPDAPAYKVYITSKHGNIFSAMSANWNMQNVPWTIGEDFTAPTCAACHISLLANTEGAVVSQRTHRINDRLPWRIFGLIYAHPHPRAADTTVIRNKDGMPMPTDYSGGFAQSFLLDEQGRAGAQAAMQATCLACHGKSWVDGHWSGLMNTIQTTNAATLAATGIMREIWKAKLASAGKDGNPFDEYPEKLWSDIWLFYANIVRAASAMAGGGDYGVFGDGRYQMMRSITGLDDWRQDRKPVKK
jgi:hypothetical protein